MWSSPTTSLANFDGRRPFRAGQRVGLADQRPSLPATRPHSRRCPRVAPLITMVREAPPVRPQSRFSRRRRRRRRSRSLQIDPPRSAARDGDAIRCAALRCDALRCAALRCAAMWCNVVQCGAMCWDVMRCDAARHSCVSTQSSAMPDGETPRRSSQCVAVRRVALRLKVGLCARRPDSARNPQ
jgi:hypothetical protein